ncbi:MAG: GNAT family N-acetyltransferase [Gammaproteobacteria bacterium]|nr:GNAT family N-acetyltransferase [Gammaproteobacteria bacterium]
MKTTIHNSFAEIGTATGQLDGGGDPFLDPCFLEAAELHGAVSRAMAWQPCHVAACAEGGSLRGLMPLYRRNHSFGDFSRDYGWAQAWRQLGHDYYPKLVTGIPYTPATGPRFLLDAGASREDTVGALLAATIDLARAAGISVWQFLYGRSDDLAMLDATGFLLRPIVQYHWQRGQWRDFGDFLDALTAKRRKEIRRERRRVAEQGLRIEVRHGDELDTGDTKLWAAIHRHYQNTFERYGTPHAFTEGFFRDVAAGLGRRFVVFIAFRGELPVASAICYRDEHTLFGRHWGADEEIDCLHFELCQYQGIDYCLREGLQHFEPGAGGEHKVNRGFLPTRTWSAYWIDEPRLRRAVADFIGRERSAIDDYIEASIGESPFRAS